MERIDPERHPQIERIDFGRSNALADRLIHADALAVAATVPDTTLDAIYIDPPFGTGTIRQGRGLRYVDRADDPEVFVDWLMPFLEHSHRTLVGDLCILM